jgi:hypothetical protein
MLLLKKGVVNPVELKFISINTKIYTKIIGGNKASD